MRNQVGGSILFALLSMTLLITHPLCADFSNLRMAWTNFNNPGYIAAYTDGGVVIADFEDSAGGDTTWGKQSPSQPEWDLGSNATSLANPGPESTCSYGYFNGGTVWNPADPATMNDDWVFFRIRLVGDPSVKGKTDLEPAHWNILFDVDGDGYKEYWLDIEGKYASGNNVYDRVQVLYENTNSQEISDPATARVQEYRAYNYEDASGFSHTRVVPANDGSGDYFLEVQLPMTAFVDSNGNQVVYPDSPIGFAFSTSTSATDPLQKDWSRDFTGGLPYDPLNPIKFGDTIKFNGEANIEFVDSTAQLVDVLSVTDTIYVLVTDFNANLSATTTDTITVHVKSPTGDDEQLVIYETGLNTGIFFYSTGLPTSTTAGANNDGNFQIFGGQIATVEYYDTNDGDTNGANNTKTDSIDFISSPDCGFVQFTRANGFDTSTYTFTTNPRRGPESDLVYITVTDRNANQNSSLVETITVTVTSSVSGDSEVITLTETGVNTGVFRNTSGLRTEIQSGGVTTNDGLLEAVDASTLTASYLDADDGDSPVDPANDVKTDTASVYVEAAGIVYLQDNGGYNKDLYALGYDGIFVTVVDLNNPKASVADTVVVTLTDSLTGDVETLLLYQTGAGTGTYSNRPTFPLDNSANASIGPITVNPETVITENWTVTYVASTDDWTVLGSVSGLQATRATTALYFSDGPDEKISFQITQTTTPADGDTFTFSTYEVLATAEALTGTAGDGVFQSRDGSIITATYYDRLAWNGSDDGDAVAANDGKTDSAVASSPSVVIDEIVYDSASADGRELYEWIRLYNSSAVGLTVTGHLLSDEDGEFTYEIPQMAGSDITLQPDEEMYILFLDGTDYYDGANGTYYLYASSSFRGTLSTTEDQISLYSSSLTAWDNIVDFVAWDNDSDATAWVDDDNNAAARPIWTELNFFDVSPAASIANTSLTTVPTHKYSIRRKVKGYDTDTPLDWEINEGVIALTYVSVLDFRATGDENRIVISWQTGVESKNAGFVLYKRQGMSGKWQPVGPQFIHSRAGPLGGASYEIVDEEVHRGELFFYRLLAHEYSGRVTTEGQICVDWDGDGIEDDWELRNGLNPDDSRDGAEDFDGDGFTNFMEFFLGLDPHHFDDRDEGGALGNETVRGYARQLAFHPGLLKLKDSLNETILVLNTQTLVVKSERFVDGVLCHEIATPDYSHGFERSAGLPQVPVKGTFIEVPQGMTAMLETIEVEEIPYGAYLPIPAPTLTTNENNVVTESRTLSQEIYGRLSSHIGVATELAYGGTRGGQAIQKVLFRPLGWNEKSQELTLRKRIVVRIKYTSAPMYAALKAKSSAWYPPTNEAVKLGVRDDGMVRVTCAQLMSASLDCGDVPSTNLHVYYQGEEIAVRVQDGGDGTFSASDSLIFYGQAVSSKYTSDNVYWVVVDENEAGQRMNLRPVTPGGNSVSSVQSTTHVEVNELYEPSVAGSEEYDRWFYPLFVMAWNQGTPTDKPTNFNVALANPDVSYGTAASLSVAIQPLDSQEEYSPDHWVSLNIGATELLSEKFDGLQRHTLRANVSHNLLVDGNNVITVTPHLYHGAAWDRFFADWFELSYRRLPIAKYDELQFSLDGGHHSLIISGFSGTDIKVFDVNTPKTPIEISGVNTAGAAADFDDLIEGKTNYIVVGPNGYHSPAWIERYDALTLQPAQSAPQLIIISTKGFESNIQPLIDHRQSQGLNCWFVPIETIFDVFNNGLREPEAIRTFLSYSANQWGPAQYLLIVGDCSYDYKNNKALSDHYDIVPTYLAMTPGIVGETATDYYYATYDGDEIPDIAVGRLPAKTASEVETMVSKIITYENNRPSLSLRGRAIVISDDLDPAFLPMGKGITNAFVNGGPYDISQMFLGQLLMTNTQLQQQLRDYLDSGAFFVNYIGHGDPTRWGDEQIMNNGLVSLLDNGSTLLPFVASSACLDGYFARTEGPGEGDCLAETLVKDPTNGAIACLASAGSSTSFSKEVLSRAVTQAILESGERRIGAIHRAALMNFLANYEDVEKVATSASLIGDPSLLLHLPAPQVPEEPNAVRADGVVLSWNSSYDDEVVGYHIYRFPSLGAQPIRLTGTPKAASTFIDVTADDSELYYGVTAVNSAGFESALSPIVTVSAQQSSSRGGGCSLSRDPENASPMSVLPFVCLLLWGLIQKRRRAQPCVSQ